MSLLIRSPSEKGDLALTNEARVPMLTPMKIVKRYPDTMTAHIARAILENEGVDSFIADENLANADPPVIFASGGVRLMVHDDVYEHAHEILNRPVEGLPDDFDPGPTAQEVKPPSTEGSFLGKVLQAIACMILGALALYGFQRSAEPPMPLFEETETSEDLDEDGKIDRITIWEGSEIVSTKEDTNGDGHFETTGEGGPRGQLKLSTDFDRDGETDYISFTEGLRFVREDWLRNGRVFKRVRFDGIRMTREELDLDGDGNYEIIRNYDAEGERIP